MHFHLLAVGGGGIEEGPNRLFSPDESRRRRGSGRSLADLHHLSARSSLSVCHFLALSALPASLNQRPVAVATEPWVILAS